jgi:hypothetical protein
MSQRDICDTAQGNCVAGNNPGTTAVGAAVFVNAASDGQWAIDGTWAVTSP